MNLSVLLDTTYARIGPSETKEESSMKDCAALSRPAAVRRCPAYPNAAGRRYFLGKLVDLLLAGTVLVSGLVILFYFIVAY